MYTAFLLIILSTGEAQVFSHPDLFMTLEECEATAAADAPAATIALGGVSSMWECRPAGELV